MEHHSGRPGLPLRIPSGSVKDTLSVEHRDAWNIAVRTRGVFTHRAVFQKPACAKRGLGRTASQLFSGELGANHTNHISSTNADKATHQPHHQRQNRASTTPPVMAEPHLLHQKLRANQASSPGNTTRQPPHQRRLHQRFLYCDGETPNISLKYFAKYFCVPKPTASETSTTLSPASADNSWAALLSRMVRMNTEGFIP